MNSGSYAEKKKNFFFFFDDGGKGCELTEQGFWKATLLSHEA